MGLGASAGSAAAAAAALLLAGAGWRARVRVGGRVYAVGVGAAAAAGGARGGARGGGRGRAPWGDVAGHCGWGRGRGGGLWVDGEFSSRGNCGIELARWFIVRVAEVGGWIDLWVSTIKSSACGRIWW